MRKGIVNEEEKIRIKIYLWYLLSLRHKIDSNLSRYIFDLPMQEILYHERINKAIRIRYCQQHFSFS